MKCQLLLINLPYNCSDSELQAWLESFAIEPLSIRIIPDLVAGVSPAFGYVELRGNGTLEEAVAVLNGKRLRNSIVLVKKAPVRHSTNMQSQAQKAG